MTLCIAPCVAASERTTARRRKTTDEHCAKFPVCIGGDEVNNHGQSLKLTNRPNVEPQSTPHGEITCFCVTRGGVHVVEAEPTD